MKKVIKLILLSLSIGLLSFTILPKETKNQALVAAKSKIIWKTEAIALGTIPQGKPRTINFEFKNTGSTAVLISNVRASCGCTATDYTKSKIISGKTGTVTVTFDAASKGKFSKTVTVITSASKTPTVLLFKGTVN